MSPPPTPELVVVGSASRDLNADDPRGWLLGGAVTYCGLVLARLGMRPRVLVGGDAAVAGAWELDLLRDAGATVETVRLERSPVFENLDVDGVRRQRCVEPGDPLDPASLPDAWRGAGAWLFGPVADELPEAWAGVPDGAAFVALGWQGLLRDLPRGGDVTIRAPGPHAIVDRASLVSVSRLDLPAATRPDELLALLRPSATLVITDGAAGGTCRDPGPDGRSVTRRYPALPSAAVVDSTGAGDAFLAGLVAARLGHPLGGSGRRGTDLRLAAALGSLAVEGPGVLGIPSLGVIADRLAASLTSR